MKVYFEASGSKWDGKKKETIYVTAYVSPTKDGHGYWYSNSGEKYQFSWVHPKDAKVFDSKDLPKDLLYSFKQGVHYFYLPGEKEANWTPEDLIYNKVDRKRLMLYNRVQRALPNVKTMADFWELYPRIKKCGYISPEMVRTLFGLIKIPRTPMRNGELGLAWMQDVEMFQAICTHFYDKPMEFIRKLIYPEGSFLDSKGPFEKAFES